MTARTVIFTIMILVLSSVSSADSISVSGGRVQGLHYDSTIADHRATFVCSAEVSDPNKIVFGYDWYLDDISLNINSATATIKAGLGKHTIRCVYYYQVWVSPPGIWFQYYDSTTTTVAAIGGPLAYDVLGAHPGVAVPKHDGGTLDKPEGDLKKPFHIQYFDYDRSLAKPSVYAQDSQFGLVIIELGQLPGTTYTWRKTGPVKAKPGTGSVNDTTYEAIPTLGCPSGGITVRVTYHYTDPLDSTLTGQADDDSEETPPPGETEPNAAYYSFTSHKPKNVIRTGRSNGQHIRGSVWPYTDPWTYQDYFFHQLKDGFGEGIGGVWIMERFPYYEEEMGLFTAQTGLSYGLKGAKEDEQWISLLIGNFGPEGTFDNVDAIGLQDIVATAQNPDPAQYPPFTYTQHFFAATRTPTVGSWGILVKTWFNTVTPVSVKHENGS